MHLLFALISISQCKGEIFQDEKSRIEALGGVVLYMGTWRVNGNLAVSRAIGNHGNKTGEQSLKEGLVSMFSFSFCVEENEKYYSVSDMKISSNLSCLK